MDTAACACSCITCRSEVNASKACFERWCHGANLMATPIIARLSGLCTDRFCGCYTATKTRVAFSSICCLPMPSELIKTILFTLESDLAGQSHM